MAMIPAFATPPNSAQIVVESKRTNALSPLRASALL